MTDEKIFPIILSGGTGTRLWPVSRKSYPKQFSKLIGDKSLFQSSVSLCLGPQFGAPMVVTAELYRFLALEQIAALEIQASKILLEPEPRNTAASALSAALYLINEKPGSLMLILPSDHNIAEKDKFQEAVIAAAPTAQGGRLVTFGIKPTRPETGYGYLELSDSADAAALKPQPLVSFVEKPEFETAREMIASERFLWNAGIFLLSPKALIEAFQEFAPHTLHLVRQAIDKASLDLGFTRLGSEQWSKLENESLDYAIMEKAQNLSVMPYNGSWSDLGSWEAVFNEIDKDASGNALSENATAIDCRETFLRSEVPGLEVVGIGLDEIITIAMPDAVLVAKKSSSQHVKDAVEKLQARNVEQANMLAYDHRPWGQFERIAKGNNYQVKRIIVNPGAALSLQSHRHRTEHWIIVSGTARVTINETNHLLESNQSIYVPLGAVHRLENPGETPVVLIEVQTGSYLGEDDIIRYEDRYARD